MTEEHRQLSAGDMYFIEQRDMILQEINEMMDSVLNNLNGINITLENSIAVGKEFENVSQIWKLFYNGLDVDEQSAERMENDDAEIGSDSRNVSQYSDLIN